VITDGTGELAAVPGYEVAGKTGTAQKPSEDGGYQEGAYIATFAGFAPADDPALVVAVMLDDPTPYYGGLTAAPVFSEIMEFALGHERVAPSDPGARLTATPAAP
jgi:cell division protein FtsI/penicillin-binding protein 2